VTITITGSSFANGENHMTNSATWKASGSEQFLSTHFVDSAHVTAARGLHCSVLSVCELLWDGDRQLLPYRCASGMTNFDGRYDGSRGWSGNDLILVVPVGSNQGQICIRWTKQLRPCDDLPVREVGHGHIDYKLTGCDPFRNGYLKAI
jgi:hypothetical protein